MTPIDHLHQETQILPIHEHSNLLCTQYLAKCTDPAHPCHTTIMNSTRPRPMKHTLLSKYSEVLNSSTHHLPPNATVKDKLRSIHTTIVEETIDSFQPNRLLNTRPPTISKTELSLPRGPRSILSQLRSGFCSKLNSFQNRIKPLIPNSCPLCNYSPHDVTHLFNCPSNPNTSNLQVQDLWTNPVPTFHFLHLLASFLWPSAPVRSLAPLPDPTPCKIVGVSPYLQPTTIHHSFRTSSPSPY